MPKSKLAKIGVWENGNFIGCVIFGVGATADLVKRFGLNPQQGCELVRVALSAHISHVSRILSIAVRILKKEFSGLRLIVSFADPSQGHVGIIYQSCGWIYTGTSASAEEYLVKGRRYHGRALRHAKPSHLTTKEAAKRLDPGFKVIQGSSKFRYLMPLDESTRRQIEPLRKPYPKRAGSVENGTSESHSEGGGVNPTSALQD